MPVGKELTKEELKKLRASLDVCIADDGSDTQLMEKLQSMINDFKETCDHKFERKILQIDLCEKCHSFKFVFEGHENE